MVDGYVECVGTTTELEDGGRNERELIETEVGAHIVRQRRAVGLLVSIGFAAEIDDGSPVDVGRRVDRLHKLPLLLIPVERRPEGTMLADSLLECLDHPVKADGDLGFNGDEVALVSIPLSGTEALHRLVDNGDIPSPGVVVLALKETNE